jgi:hypothetical protein
MSNRGWGEEGVRFEAPSHIRECEHKSAMEGEAWVHLQPAGPLFELPPTLLPLTPGTEYICPGECQASTNQRKCVASRPSRYLTTLT